MLDSKTDVVKNPRISTDFTMPDMVMGLVNEWGKISHKEERKNHLEFLDWNKQKLDWENDDLDDTAELVENTHPEIPEQIPGIELANEQDNYGDLI